MRFNIATLLFSIGVIAAPMWPSCYQLVYSQTALTADKAQTSEQGGHAEEKQENEEVPPCLREDAPRPKLVVSSGVMNSRAIEIPKPTYPEIAKAAKISGEVKVSAIVDEKGEVVWARIHSGHPLLQMAVRKVVCQARFKPIKLSGRPVAVNGIIVYRFVLE